MKPPLFHLAFPVDDLQKARDFYGSLLGCAEGRSSKDWVDFNFYGHQIVAHLAPGEAGHRNTSVVDGDNVPVRHFGAILPMADWVALADRLKRAGTILAQGAKRTAANMSTLARRATKPWAITRASPRNV